VKPTLIACPRCFHNHGLRMMAAASAIPCAGQCPQCGLEGADKLSDAAVENLVAEFFVSGSILSETHAPVFQANTNNP